MFVTTELRQAPWRAGFTSLDEEQPEPRILDVQGALPPDLEGTLYRIGPGRFHAQGEPYAHWFDGDGMVHAFTIGSGAVHHRSRYVATDKVEREAAAGRRLGPGFGTPPAGSPLRRLRHLLPDNAANTNLSWHGGRLHALWEQGRPWRLDAVTLETLGEDDLDGALGARDTWSAHPKAHPTTGDLWNFGVRYGSTTRLTLLRTTLAGQTEVVSRRRLTTPAMVHDFAVTERHVVVLVPPLALPRVPVGLLLGRRSYAEALRWRPSLGTAVLVYDLHTGRWSDHRTDAVMFFHVAGAHDDGDDVVVDVCGGTDRRLFDDVGGFLHGRAPTAATSVLRIRVGATRPPSLSTLSDQMLDFPQLVPSSSERPARLFGVGPTDPDGFPGTPIMIDLGSGRVSRWDLGPARYAGECIPVAKGDGGGGVWLLTLVLDGSASATALTVLDGEDPSAPPVATATLPHLVPFGFHGTWVPAAATTGGGATGRAG